MWVPFIGWVIGGALIQSKMAPVQRALSDQVSARKVPPKIDWPSSEQESIAERMGRICMEEVGWPNCHFIPEDQFEAMIEWRTGDLCEVAALMAIEGEFRVEFPEDFMSFVSNATFGSVVKWVEANQKSTAAQE